MTTSKPRALVACEYSGRVRDALIRNGFDAMSCDLLPTDVEGPHYQGDVFDVINDGWDLMVAHPPCTHLAVSGARWFHKKQKEQAEALEFVQQLLDAPIKYIALENPVSIIASRIRKPDQIVQPWQFGDAISKKTCWWLKGLPPLTPTNIVDPGEFHTTASGKKLPLWYHKASGKDRWKIRSTTHQGIADAIGDQWGLFVLNQFHSAQ